MNASELLNTVIAHGADERGINDRFSGNAELYEMCFLEFLREPNHILLSADMGSGDYAAAFAAAHALKGLSGNLGLTGYYEAICALVETLRPKELVSKDDAALAGAQFEAVRGQYLKLVDLAAAGYDMSDVYAAAGLTSGETPETEPPPIKTKPPRKRGALITVLLVVLAVAFICVGYLFCRIFVGFRKNVTRESAEHLVEISCQLRLYIEEKINNDRRTARSVGDSIIDGNYASGAAILAMMERKRAVWDVTGIMLHTEDGLSLSVPDGGAPSGFAPDAVYKARLNGEHISAAGSDMIYTVPLETRLEYGGSRITAVSVVQRMDDFLENMGFSSFGGDAFLYLTDAAGEVISGLASPLAAPLTNFVSVTEGREILPLAAEPGPGEGLLTSAGPAVFLMTGGGEDTYIVSSPVSTGGAPLRIFYLAPAAAVNATMNRFSRRLLLLSVLVILMFTGFAVVAFVFVYRAGKKQLDEALLARERMLDLLVENTRAAFGLFTVNAPRPVYISPNTASVIGDEFWGLFKSGDGFFMRAGSGRDTDAVRAVNKLMRGWDGRSAFKSGYLINDSVVPPVYFELQLYPAGGEEDAFVGIAQDVTQAYERETAAMNALGMAKQANEAKARFLSNMSHDIRTPMNAIVNMTEFAMNDMHDPRRLAGYLQTIRSSSGNLLRMINDVLDMSRIESREATIDLEPIDVRAELERQADMIRPLSTAKRQTLMTDFDGISAGSVLGDPVKLSQIFSNLLANAVKFTPENGVVRFTAAEIPSLSDDMVDVRFTVEDNGIGIPKDYIEHVFEPFSRADDKRVSLVEGSGLGLSICHSYVSAMGGAIKCESEPGEGTLFTVELFFRRSGEQKSAPQPAGTPGDILFPGKRCLVAEDNRTNQTIAKTMLEQLGFVVDIAPDGWECVKKFRRSAPGFYDIVYMDIQMPLMDGYEAAVAIRESEHPQARSIPIVAMTANVFAEDIEKARIAGMDGHLGKPIISLKLAEETYRVLNRRGEGGM